MLGVRDVKDDLCGGASDCWPSDAMNQLEYEGESVRVGSHPANSGIALPIVFFIRHSRLVLVRDCALCCTAFI